MDYESSQVSSLGTFNEKALQNWKIISHVSVMIHMLRSLIYK